MMVKIRIMMMLMMAMITMTLILMITRVMMMMTVQLLLIMMMTMGRNLVSIVLHNVGDEEAGVFLNPVKIRARVPLASRPGEQTNLMKKIHAKVSS
jgi:hypothetical protein